MSFKRQLDEARKMGFSISELKIAEECEFAFNFEYNSDEFERLCEVAHICYIKAERMTEFAIAMAINDFIVEDGYSVNDVLSMYIWDLIRRADNWL